MKSISLSTFVRFTGQQIESFLPKGVNPSALQEIQVRITKLSDLIGRKAQENSWNGSCGESLELNMFFAILENGKVLDSPPPDYRQGSNYAYSTTEEGDGTPLGEAWGNDISRVRYVVEYYRDFNDWEGTHDYRNERILVLHIVRDDDEERIRRIRRRAEDALRKSNPTQVLRIASILEVKLD